jgi:hypothetical protein
MQSCYQKGSWKRSLAHKNSFKRRTQNGSKKVQKYKLKNHQRILNNWIKSSELCKCCLERIWKLSWRWT